jgi:hypothetical protein
MGGMDLDALALGGVFSARHATAVGIGGTALRRLVRAGACHPLHRGWYAVRRPRDAQDHHRLRTAALLQEYAGQAVASHGSAVVRLGLPTEAVDFGTVHLMWLDPKRPFQAFSRTKIHERIESARLPPGQETVHPALACVQVGQSDPRALIVAADAGLRSGLLDESDLDAACQALRGQRGMTRVRATVGLCDRRHESPGESLTAYVLALLGYEVDPQFAPGTVGPGGGLEHCDFRIKGTRVLVEFDGKEKYVAPTPQQAQELLFAEKRREDAIRGRGYGFVRATWVDLHRPAQLRAKIEQAEALIGGQPLRATGS